MQTLSLRKGERVIARFGNAELLVDALGRAYLRGGSAHEVAEAREWISIFFHEAVPAEVLKTN